MARLKEIGRALAAIDQVMKTLIASDASLHRRFDPK
jgi:hypothetical protein